MSDSTQHLDTLLFSASDKEITANELFDAMSQAADYGRRAEATSGLTWGQYGNARVHINATATLKANTTIALTASSTRFVSMSRALAYTEVATAFAVDKLALYRVVTLASTVTSYEDHRDQHHFNRFFYGRVAKAMADANQTLTYQEAMCESIEATGALTALRDIIVPLVPRDWKIFANVTGGFGVRVIAASGTGITIADGKRAIVECDGTNVVRVTADV